MLDTKLLNFAMLNLANVSDSTSSKSQLFKRNTRRLCIYRRAIANFINLKDYVLILFEYGSYYDNLFNFYVERLI